MKLENLANLANEGASLARSVMDASTGRQERPATSDTPAPVPDRSTLELPYNRFYSELLDGGLIRLPTFPNEPEVSSYDDSDLYGPNGPRSDDIQQNGIGDCYFVATLASVADQDPGHIQESIRYNEATETFTVTFYEPGPDGKPVEREIEVTQAEIQDNIDRGGGSWPDGPIWPAVMEAAYAKMHLQDAPLHDGKPDPRIDGGYGPGSADRIGPDGKPVLKLDANGDPIPLLDENGDPKLGLDGEPLYEHEQVEVGGMGAGGLTSDAAYTVTGEDAHAVQAPTPTEEPSFFDVIRDWISTESTGRMLQESLEDGATVTVSVADENPGETPDGLQGGHAYTVNRVYKDGNGVWQVELRNPWGHNGGDGTPIEGIGDGGAIITVPLDSIHTGGYEGFVISPKSSQ